MIRSFRDRDTRELFDTENSRRFSTISRVAMRKLIQLNQAVHLNDLRVPPGNRLKAGKGALSGWHSIRSMENLLQMDRTWTRTSVHRRQTLIFGIFVLTTRPD